jgi:hypothetical protein
MNESFLWPHPDERAAGARVEGWQQVSAVRPSFEMPAREAGSKMRPKDEAFISERRLTLK